ncbi:MAG: recombination protein O N-terminal domain-containing protein [Schleiferiaceae bacterium]|nr:recombination protein O N-terminal domain-containing protein [Schleiferiaceae bacterium]
MKTQLFSEQIVVLSKLPYSDNSAILRCYSNVHGAKAFIISTSKKGAVKPAMALPLSILNIITATQGGNKLARIKEAQLAQHSPGALGNPIKTALTFFTTEVLENLIREEFENETLYAFITRQIQTISDNSMPPAAFPLTFIIGVIEQLGFLPQTSNYQPNSYFDMREGQFCQSLPFHPEVIDKKTSEHWYVLLNGYQQGYLPELSRAMRNELLDSCMRFLTIHNDHFRKLKSLSVIREVL